MIEEYEKKKGNNFGWYIFVFFVGCFVMYSLFKYLPTSVTENITKLEKDVTVTDKGIADAVEKIYDAVVVVSTYADNQYKASGTGFVYKKDGKKYYILTNNHVIEGGNKINVTFTNGDIVETTVIGSDKYSDVALLSIKSDKDLAVAEIGSSIDARIGDTSFAVGAPLDSAYSWTVTRGILSGKDRMVEVPVSGSSSNDYVMKVLQTDTSINPGNSGGPLCNANGQVIGITSMKLASSGVEGMGFAIPIEDALAMADRLMGGKEIEYPYLGISMYDISMLYYYPQYSRFIKDYGSTNGVFVRSVEDGSAADKAGVKANDIITEIDGKEATNSAYLKYYLYQHHVGDTIKLKVYRDGKDVEIEIKLGSNKQTM